MQEESVHKLGQLYLGPAFHTDPAGRKYWHPHPKNYKNPAIIVDPHPSQRVNIDVEVRNHGECDVEDVNIFLYLAEISLMNVNTERASGLLRNVVKNSEPLERWTNQVVPHSTSDQDRVWRIPGGSIQAKLHESSFENNFAVVVVVEREDVKFLLSLKERDFDLSTLPHAAVWSSTLPKDD